MNNLQETHPFQVSVWVSGNENPQSVLEKGRWQEMARCMSKWRADELAICLSLRWSGVQAAELIEDERGKRFVGYKYLPEEAKHLS